MPAIMAVESALVVLTDELYARTKKGYRVQDLDGMHITVMATRDLCQVFNFRPTLFTLRIFGDEYISTQAAVCILLPHLLTSRSAAAIDQHTCEALYALQPKKIRVDRAVYFTEPRKGTLWDSEQEPLRNALLRGGILPVRLFDAANPDLEMDYVVGHAFLCWMEHYTDKGEEEIDFGAAAFYTVEEELYFAIDKIFMSTKRPVRAFSPSLDDDDVVSAHDCCDEDAVEMHRINKDAQVRIAIAHNEKVVKINTLRKEVDIEREKTLQAKEVTEQKRLQLEITKMQSARQRITLPLHRARPPPSTSNETPRQYRSEMLLHYLQANFHNMHNDLVWFDQIWERFMNDPTHPFGGFLPKHLGKQKAWLRQALHRLCDEGHMRDELYLGKRGYGIL